MRRVLMVLTVAALLAAMMVSAGSAQAQANETNFENSTNVVCGEALCFGGGDIDDFDGVLFGSDLFDFDLDDVFGDDDDEFENSVFVSCAFGCNVRDFDLPEIKTNIA